jgi:hypothetical protein
MVFRNIKGSAGIKMRSVVAADARSLPNKIEIMLGAANHTTSEPNVETSRLVFSRLRI